MARDYGAASATAPDRLITLEEAGTWLSVVDRIRGLVADAGSVNATALAIGLKQQTLNRIVRGEHAAPRVETLQKIAEFFDTTVDWLLTGKGRNPTSGALRVFERKLPRFLGT